MDARERMRQLMMARLDGELDESERNELETALAEHPELRVELRRMEQLGRRLEGVRLKDPADEVLAELDASLVKRAGLSLGWLLLLAGALVLGGWLTWAWLSDPDLPAALRWGGLALFAGILALLGVKIKERWIERRSDPYRDVIR